MDSVLGFRGFGHPRTTPPYEISNDPTTQKMISGARAEMEGQRLRTEAEMKTPEGLKKAAEAKLAERQRKERDWFSRVIYDHGNGWKPIWGSAEDEELRIYTSVNGGAHRFWGVKPIGMNIYDFWRKYDPDVERYVDRQQETPANPDAPVGPLIGEPSRSITPKKAAAKPRKQRKIPEINSTNRVRRSRTKSQEVKSTRKSLAFKVDAGNLQLEDQEREVPPTPRVGSRTTRIKIASTASSSQQKQAAENEGLVNKKNPRGRPATRAKEASKDGTLPPKHPRGRPPVKGKPTERPPKQKKTPAVKGNVRVTKSPQKAPPPLLPSTHKMRTRRAGPAELLQLP